MAQQGKCEEKIRAQQGKCEKKFKRTAACKKISSAQQGTLSAKKIQAHSRVSAKKNQTHRMRKKKNSSAQQGKCKKKISSARQEHSRVAAFTPYPAVLFFFSSHLSYPAVSGKKFFFALSCYAHIPLFAYHLPCYAFIFLLTYRAVPLFFFSHNPAVLCPYPAFR